MMKKILFSILTLAMGLVLSGSGCDNGTDPVVDPNGVLIGDIVWAKYNVAAPGVFATTPESVGMFYQWNRRVGYSATNPLTPAWNATPAGGASWATANDPCPAGWRVPTKADFDNLVAYDQGWNAAKKGSTFGTAPNTIFLPAAGFREASIGSFQYVGVLGNYWASTEFDPSEAYRLNIEAGFSARSNISFGKANGCPVRCVKR